MASIPPDRKPEEISLAEAVALLIEKAAKGKK
jgi:topoisomerase IA-like protein